MRNSDGAHIPADEANADYRAFLAWEASGKTAAPYVAPFNPDAVSAECKRRIFAVASTNAQVNMAAARRRYSLASARGGFSRRPDMDSGHARSLRNADRRKRQDFRRGCTLAGMSRRRDRARRRFLIFAASAAGNSGRQSKSRNERSG